MHHHRKPSDAARLVGPIPSNFVEKSTTWRKLVAFDEAIDILRPHTTPPHRWRAAERALEACSRLAEDPTPICSFKTMSAMRWGLHCDFVCACLPGRAPRGARCGPCSSWANPALCFRSAATRPTFVTQCLERQADAAWRSSSTPRSGRPVYGRRGSRRSSRLRTPTCSPSPSVCRAPCCSRVHVFGHAVLTYTCICAVGTCISSSYSGAMKVIR